MMMKKKNRLIVDVLLLIAILCYSCAFAYMLFNLSNNNIHTIDFTIRPTTENNIPYKFGVSYGTINLSHQFNGELIKTKEYMVLDQNSTLSAKKYDVVKKGDEIARLNDEIIYSTFNGIILDVEHSDNLKILYQNFDKSYCLFETDLVFSSYFNTYDDYSVFIKDIAKPLKIKKVEQIDDRILVTTDYFFYSQYMSEESVYLKLNIENRTNILRIENKYLTNQISENLYMIKVYNPNLTENKIYDVIIETGIQNEKYTEIVSSNLFPSEAIIE